MSSSKRTRNIPPLKINLKLILSPSANVTEYICDPDDTAQEISDRVYASWPDNWPEDEKPATNILRLIYQGRFLHGSVTLEGLNLTLGRTTVMHLVSREKLPDANSYNQMKKDRGINRNCSLCCTIV